MRTLVSKDNRRFQLDGLDLNLSYITPRIIAMGFPAVGLEAAYRNSMEQVQLFFSRCHRNNSYRVYNTCSERSYDAEALGGPSHPDCLRHFPFDDHNPPCFDALRCVT